MMMTTKTRSHRNKAPRRRLRTFGEPRLRFGFGQTLDDPKDGLLLFGPPGETVHFRYGVIGTPEGIARFEAWAEKLQGPIAADPNVTSSVIFPGFETVFRAPWNPKPRVSITVDSAELARTVRITDAHQRVFDTVELFAGPINAWVTEEGPRVALWFVVIPEEVWKLCRPKSTITHAEGTAPEIHLSHARATALLTAPDLFDEVNVAAEKHLYENHFHNQLKAKLLETEAITQIVRETTITPFDFLNRLGKPARRIQDEATIAWNLATAIYYKAGEKPWTLADSREGVCYIGLVFKRTNNPGNDNEACCGAQMFLHSGEGIVFKGSVGPWVSERPGEFRLPRHKAAEIVQQCVETYEKWHGGKPRELFIHGRTVFDPEEIEGFKEGAPKGTSVTGIQIRRPNDLKLFSEGRLAIDRPDQVWCADLTYIPVSRGFLYLVAIMDWASRHVLA